MFNVFRKSQPHHPTPAIVRALVSGGLPPGMEPSTLSVVEQHGSYSGRRVNYFRAFDPVRVGERGLQIRKFADLDSHPELVLGSGHIESDGTVVFSAHRDSHITAAAPSRREADRSAHTDDEQVVFPTPQG
jgi:hypothetical protein